MAEAQVQRIVEVFWEDSASQNGWTDNVPDPAMCRSVGYVQREDDKAIVLSSNVADSSHPSSQGALPFSQSIAIPRSAVRKVKVIRRG